MNSFLAHLGDWNAANLDETVSRRCSLKLLAKKLPRGTERDYFENDAELHSAFPTGTFNVWGVPDEKEAKANHDKTDPGDVVFIAPTAGNEGLVQYFGVVKAVPRLKFVQASRLLWPQFANDKSFPYLFFFNTEAGMITWYDFTTETNYQSTWNPHAYYVRLASFKFKNSRNYLPFLDHLRANHRFKPIV